MLIHKKSALGYPQLAGGFFAVKDFGVLENVSFGSGAGIHTFREIIARVANHSTDGETLLGPLAVQLRVVAGLNGMAMFAKGR